MDDATLGGGIDRSIPPASGRRRSPAFTKGRQLDDKALQDVQALLDGEALRRDRLIEYLHLIQDSYGSLSAGHLQALGQAMGIPMAEVYEVASFYAHFDIVLDGEEAPPPITVRVCDSITCEMMGAKALLQELPEILGPGVRVLPAPCMGRCACAPTAEVGHRHIDAATTETIAAAVATKDTHPVIADYKELAAYQAEGGYDLLRACLKGERSADEIITILSDSNLRGLGGAGFPAGRKWSIVRDQPGPRLMTINGDEGEPGTFKDRVYLEQDPHRFLEGTLIAAWAVGCEKAYIYMRDEYPGAIAILKREIAKLEAEGLSVHCPLEIRRGAGAYICGEESAMIESIEGKRGLPRHRPPYIAQVGLFDRPTLNHNVETVYWVREIVEKGADWFSGQGRHGRKGLRSFSVSGRVAEPGVKLAPAGITIKELIDEYCGGMADGHSFKAYLPGGASGGILPASMSDIPLDFGTLEEHGCFIGSAAVVVLSDKDSIREAVLNLMRFFKEESCGQCTPCRVGTEKAVALMEETVWDKPLLEDLNRAMRDASICGLGQAAPNPLACALKYFPEEV
ncbi:NADH-ubiquinone oxidoreductase-F iron-sulfur binding region domain-containing protein [Limibacillus sp. MBR-115]|jgi:formate dehydrogenase|uniref:NADH-ubiquinone oxidoreductase-F iron-sulfur binding region domain-containing protein n=1 Tax=Limibacillus sp. MBR-115 TaxID=3156465 RepID=UPI00339777EC